MQKDETLLKHQTEEWKNCNRMADIMTAAYEICESKCDKSRKKLYNVVKNTILYFEPDFFDYVIQLKQCNRKLRYIGDTDDFFQKGEIYESIDFTGATYSIKGYSRRIGCNYFERIT